MLDSKRLIELALRGLELERQRIQIEIDALQRQVPKSRQTKLGKKPSSKSRLTPEGRRKLSDAMKARWAARRAEAAPKKARSKAK
jgi:Spy/CpxP family protein refolding chaperone